MMRFFRAFGTATLFVSLIFVSVVFFSLYTYAQVSGENKELNIDLVPPEVYQYTSIYSTFDYQWKQKRNIAKEGAFSVESTRGRYKNRMSGAVTTRNLDYLALDKMYEAWLVDVETGYTLSLGLFSVDQDGDVRFSWSHPGYVNAYDMIVVTKEPYPDKDPRPSGVVVLVGYFDTSSLTKSSVSYGTGQTLGEYSAYGNAAESVFG